MHEKEPMLAPIFDMLVRHARKNSTSFHVPGHKQRVSFQEDNTAQAIFGAVLPIDVTELSETDDLHDPSGAIAKAQALAAQCFGAEETRFLVGGSTAGNLAMILGVCEPGEILLVQRNVHKSIIHGLALAGTRCVFLAPDMDKRSGIATAPGVEMVVQAVEKYPDAKALILCSPNYYGMTADLKRLVEIAHAKEIPVLVDEAHGAHFGQHPDLPMSALQAGADVVVQSTHKMLGAMTMGAMLHMQGKLVPRAAIRQALRMVQSSSPSYPLLASLDLARREIQAQGPSLFDQALSLSREIRAALEDLPFEALQADDPLKLSLRDRSGRLTGFDLQSELEARGCLAEMADPVYTVLALGSGSRQEDATAIIAALQDIAEKLEASHPPNQKELAFTGHSAGKDAVLLEWVGDEGAQIPEPVSIKRRMSSTIAVPLKEAAGSICGEWIIPYPPGIPLLYPGERISKAAVDELTKLADAGARFQGASDEALSSIRILAEGDRP